MSQCSFSSPNLPLIQGSYKVLNVLEVPEFDFLTFKSWKTLENSHINDEVLEKCLKYLKTIYMN